MDVIMDGATPVETVTGAGGEEAIQIHAQAFVNLEVPDHNQAEVKSIAEKESEVLSLIILNNEDGTSSNVEIENPIISVEENAEQPLSTIQEDSLTQNMDVGEALKPDHLPDQLPPDFVGENMVTMEFHAADASWITLLDRFELLVNDNRIRGYVEGEKQFLCLWESFQTSTMSTFSVRSSDKFYKIAKDGEDGAINGRILKGAPKWSRTPLVPYDGIPFVSIDRKYFGCRLGGAERQNRRKGQFKTTRTGHSMKVGCPADADVLEVWRVPGLAIPDNIKSNREKRRIKTHLLSQVHDFIRLGRFIKRYYVTLPLITKHQNHPVLDNDAGRLKVLHPRVIEKIYDIVQQGIYEKRVVKYMLQEFVQEFQTELGIEIQESDRSFYPTDRDISNHIRNAKTLAKKEEAESSVAQEDTQLQPETTGIQPSDLTYDTEVVASHTFPDISSNCEVTYNMTPAETALYHTTTSVADTTNFVTTMADTGNAEYSEATKNFLTPQDVTTLEDIVQQSVLQYYQNSNIEVTVSEEAPQIIETPVAPDTGNISTEMDVNALIEHCKRNPNPVKKKSRKWSHKGSKSLHKHMDMKALLKYEIDNSFTVINQALVNENDEAKLKLILKKVKMLQRIVQGREIVKRRGRRSGIHAMVNIENIKQDL